MVAPFAGCHAPPHIRSCALKKPIWRWIFIGCLQNTPRSSSEMFTFDQTLVILERESVTLLLVQKCFLYRA